MSVLSGATRKIETLQKATGVHNSLAAPHIDNVCWKGINMRRGPDTWGRANPELLQMLQQEVDEHCDSNTNPLLDMPGWFSHSTQLNIWHCIPVQESILTWTPGLRSYIQFSLELSSTSEARLSGWPSASITWICSALALHQSTLKAWLLTLSCRSGVPLVCWLSSCGTQRSMILMHTQAAPDSLYTLVILTYLCTL